MAVNETRNLSAELRNGITDGSVKKQAPDRGGSVEGDHTNDVLQTQYGVLTYGSLEQVELMANRVHDGRFMGEQGPMYTWTNTSGEGDQKPVNLPSGR